MPTYEALTAIYSKYEEKLAKVMSKTTIFSGAFGMGDDPRKHPCNVGFYEEVEEWVRQFLEEAPGTEEAARAARYILEYPAGVKDTPSFWYTFAAMQHAGPLVPLLSADDAAQMAQSIRNTYSKTEILPVQEALLKQLDARTGRAAEPKKPGYLETWGRRVLMLLVGLTIAHLGVTLFVLAELGSDPFNVMIQGIHLSPIGSMVSHGIVHAAVSALIVGVLLFVDRTYIRIGTLLCMILGGPIIDLFSMVLGGIINAGTILPGRIAAVTLGCCILAFGMTIVIQSQAGTGPNDLVAVVLSDKLHKKFGIVRILVDCAFALTGFLLGGTAGIGTLICMAVVGPVAQVFMPVSKKICGLVLSEQESG